MANGLDRRKFARIPVIVLCDIIRIEVIKVEGRGCLINCSLGGVAVVSKVDVDVDDRIILRFDLNNEHKDVMGIVAYKRMVMGDLFGYGVRCVKMEFDGVDKPAAAEKET